MENPAQALQRRSFNDLVLIGGDGTFRGGIELGRTWPGRIIGLLATIDNDLFGADFTIGYETAMEIAAASTVWTISESNAQTPPFDPENP